MNPTPPSLDTSNFIVGWTRQLQEYLVSGKQVCERGLDILAWLEPKRNVVFDSCGSPSAELVNSPGNTAKAPIKFQISYQPYTLAVSLKRGCRGGIGSRVAIVTFVFPSIRSC